MSDLSITGDALVAAKATLDTAASDLVAARALERTTTLAWSDAAKFYACARAEFERVGGAPGAEPIGVIDLLRAAEAAYLATDPTSTQVELPILHVPAGTITRCRS